MELLKKTAVEIRKMLINKEVSAVELVEDTYKRIDSVEEKIGAFNSLTKKKLLKPQKKLMKKLKIMKNCQL